MVIGNGMIAKCFNSYADDANLLVFASGVSNSAGAVKADYTREEILLRKTIEEQPGKTLIYFSTCSIYDPSLQETSYVQHKLKMELLIQSSAASYYIFRVSNPVGFTSNQHTVLNYFVAHIQTKRHFTLWQYASRNLIDIEDVLKLCTHTIQSKSMLNSIINIANPVNYPVISIIEAIEKHIAIKGNYDIAEKGNSPLIDTSAIQPLFRILHIEFNNDYLSRLLQKYFPII